MEEKKSRKTTILTVLLIILIAIICVMGYFIYQVQTEKENVEEELKATNEQLATLENTMGKIEEQINSYENETSETNDITGENANQGNSNQNTTTNLSNENVNLENGNYIVQGYTVTPDAEYYGIESITISGENEFSVNLPLGTSYVGKYTIEGNSIICNAEKETNEEGGGYREDPSNYTFKFEIIDAENLKLTSVSDSSLNYTIGATYKLQ